jgi:hypothetical protein
MTFQDRWIDKPARQIDDMVAELLEIARGLPAAVAAQVMSLKKETEPDWPTWLMFLMLALPLLTSQRGVTVCYRPNPDATTHYPYPGRFSAPRHPYRDQRLGTKQPHHHKTSKGKSWVGINS